LLQEAVGLRQGHVRVHGLMGDDLYVIESRGGPAGAFRFAANLADNAQEVENREIAPLREQSTTSKSIIVEGCALLSNNQYPISVTQNTPLSASISTTPDQCSGPFTRKRKSAPST
jgi:hypothetical protein